MNSDFLDLLRALLAAEARFMVVGAYAVGVHGHPRATKDLDIWVEPSFENAPKLIAALMEFGAPLMGLTARDLETAGTGLQIGREPLRIDILTKVSGPSFAESWPSRIQVSFGSDVRCPVIGIDALIANKRAAGRLQDLADVETLERIKGRAEPTEKDAEVLSALRGPVRQVIDCLVAGNYAEVVRLASRRLSTADIAAAIGTYGRTLVTPPDEAFGLMEVVAVRDAVPRRWLVTMPLWTHEEGRSDLSIELELVADGEGFLVELDDIHVL